jgi:hypothetical protein
MNLNNVYFVQYSIENGTVISHKINRLKEITSNKYVPDAKFWGPERASKYGLKISSQATHWGLFYIANLNSPKLLLSDEIPVPHAKKIWTLKDNYVIMRRADKYMKVYISPHKNVQSLKKTYNKDNS